MTNFRQGTYGQSYKNGPGYRAGPLALQVYTGWAGLQKIYLCLIGLAPGPIFLMGHHGLGPRAFGPTP
jgi:hypothetical protein